MLVVVREEVTWDTPGGMPGEQDGSSMPPTGMESWEAMRVLSRLQYEFLCHLFINAGFMTQV